MLPPERDHRSIDTYLEQLHRRTVHLACRRRIVFGNLKKALVLSSSTSALKRREKSTSNNAERMIGKLAKSRPKRHRSAFSGTRHSGEDHVSAV
jgi:hypothetical protein